MHFSSPDTLGFPCPSHPPRYGRRNKIYLARRINHDATHYALLSNLELRPVTSLLYVCITRLEKYEDN